MILFLNKGISIPRYFSIITILLISLNLTACGGGSSSTNFASSSAVDNSDGNNTPPADNDTPPPSNGGGNPSCTATGTATASYVITWDDLVDPNNTISGYKVYYDTNSNVSKANAMGSFTLSGTASGNNYLFTPGTYNLQACTTYYFAVASVTINADESQLSKTVSVLVE